MNAGRWITGSVIFGAGVAHLLFVGPLAAVVPDYLPAHRLMVELSGVTAILGGAGLLWRRTQPLAAWGMVGWLVAVWPANLWMAQHPDHFPAVPAWLFWVRLPLQLPMLWWVWRYTRPRAW